MIRRRSGFTLVELMVVAVIVAILASVSIPLMTGNRKRAMATEGEAGLGTVRVCLRAMYAQTGVYNKDVDGKLLLPGVPVIGSVPGLLAGDLDGRYFDDSAYRITAISPVGYTLTVLGDDSTAPEAAQIAGVRITIDETGLIQRFGL